MSGSSYGASGNYGFGFETAFNNMFKKPALMGNLMNGGTGGNSRNSNGGGVGGGGGEVVQGKDKTDCSCMKVKTGEGNHSVIKGKLNYDPLAVSKGVDFVGYTRKTTADRTGDKGFSPLSNSRGVGFTNY